MENLFKALALAQGEMTRVAKNSKNPHFKAQYANLDDIIDMARPVLNKHGLAIIQMPVMSDGDCGVQSIITHSSGEQYDCGTLTLPLGRGGGAQGAGSSISYARRYAFASIFAISLGDDDDGNQAQANKPTQEHDAIQAALKAFSEEFNKDEAKGLVKRLGADRVVDLPKGSLEKITALIQERRENA